ncbi:MAG TPA: glycoside hydrolase family 97 protein [Gemmatimonadaceae bacterium]|nr:glycoside hydrolase family 97 protein [Gemmatimonadaceae bacterium]
MTASAARRLARRLPPLAAVALAPLALGAQQTYRVRAPSGGVEATVSAGARLAVEVRVGGAVVVTASPIGLDVVGRLDAARMPRVTRTARRAVRDVIVPAVAEKRSRIPDRYDELRVELGPTLALVVRAYDDGVAYRFETRIADSITVRAEHATFRFAPDDSAYVPLVTCRTDPGVDCFHSSYEENYQHLPLRAIPSDRRSFVPVLAVARGGTRVLLTESDLWDYPGLWVKGVAGTPALEAIFPAYPLADSIVGGEFRQRVVTRRADYIARTAGTRTFPWRVMMLASSDAALVENDLVYRLARPQMLADASWVRPGKSTEEWITSRLLWGVPFTSGLNTATYRYMVDFAADYGLEYVMFDAGWSTPENPLERNKDIDLPAVIEYARSKGVGIILWNLALGIDTHMDAALDQYAAWGVKGILVDFMDRDDQPMVRFYERVAREAAKRKMFVNLHGAYKPTGMQRAYPNLLTRESVLGHEYDMWSDRVTPEHALTIPFIRMQAGPMDFEGGDMLNATKKEFRAFNDRPLSQGTRTQALAQYVIYESPLQYLGGSVSDYRADSAFTRVLAAVPTTWDETRAVKGEVGELLVLARRSGRDWWVAAMTSWTPRTVDVPLASFLPRGSAATYDATIVADGANADRYAGDRTIDRVTLTAGDTLHMRMAPGGAYVAHLRAR